MQATITINPVQREVFYELALDHLSGAGDLGMAIAQGDLATAERRGIELGEDLRLMEDLGWEREPRRAAELRMPPEDLAEILTRLRADAEGGLRDSGDERDANEADDAARRRYRLALDACNGLLAQLDRQGARR